MKKTELTSNIYWDNYWEDIHLPKEIKRENKKLFINKILDVFDSYLPEDPKLSIAEIGGAPGQYLAYFAKRYGYNINCIDYSKIGCVKTKENLSLLKIKCNIFKTDILKNKLDLPKFDIVVSLGFIEHFNDINFLIRKHLEILKPGGLLILGVPNFLGVNKFFLKILCPDLLSKHNLKIMNSKYWDNFQNKFQLKKIFLDYIGGFEPSIINRIENKSLKTNLIKLIPNFLNKIFHNNFKVLRSFNSKYFSGYLLGIYRKKI